MRILMIAPTPFFADRGCHVRILEEAKALQRAGHAVTISTYHHGRNMAGLDIRRTPRVSWYRKLDAGPSVHKFYVDPMLTANTLAVGRAMRPDIIHAHLHEGAMLGILLRRALRVPVVLDYQGSLSRELVDHRFVAPEGLLVRGFAAIERWIERAADAVLLSASNGIPTIERNRGGRGGSFVVLDAIDTTPAPDRERIEEARRRWRVPAGRPIVVFMGLLNPYQGLDLLFEAIPRVLGRRADAHFLVIGFPEQSYVARAGELGLADAMTFTGRVPYEETGPLLALSDVAVSPKISQSEANLKLFSYMGASLPIVVFDTPVNREALGDLGEFAPLGDAGAFADGIVALLDRPERRAELGTALRERARATMSWDSRVELLEQAYAAARSSYASRRRASPQR